MLKYLTKDVYIENILAESFWLLSGIRFKKIKSDFF